jgi:hypothetical protein
MLAHRTVSHPNVATVSPSGSYVGPRSPAKRLPPLKDPEEEEEDIFQQDLQTALRQSRRDMKQSHSQDAVCLE